MQLQAEERAILIEVAQQRGAAPEALIQAVEDESAREVAAALAIDEAEAEARLAPVRRIVAVNDDWGAGCKLLTDELRGELRAALRGLAGSGAYSASSGVSQG